MAQLEGIRHPGKSTADHHPIHGGGDSQQASHGSSSQSLMTPTSSRGYHGDHHEKKSVLLKVKEKANKWKHLLQKKKHGHRTNSLNSFSTSSQAMRMNKLSQEKEEHREEEPEVHRAPMNKPEMPSDIYKDATAEHFTPSKVTIAEGSHPTRGPPATSTPTRTPKPTPAPVAAPAQTLAPTTDTTTNTSGPSFIEKDVREDKQNEDQAASAPPPDSNVPTNIKPSAAATTTEVTLSQGGAGSKSVTETVTDMLAPAYTMVTEATSKITSSIPHIPLLTPRDEAVAKQVWDKGVSVKEYLWQKLEPGDDDRALSQLITETIGSSPRSGDTPDGGVVERVKGAFSSLLGMEHAATAPTNATAAANAPSTAVPRTGSFPASSHRTRFPPAPLKVSHSFTPSTRATNTKDSPTSSPSLVMSRTMPRSLSRRPYPNSVTALNSMSSGGKLTKCTTTPRGALTSPRIGAGEIEETGEKTLQEYLLRL